MPANLTPQYHRAEEEYRRAQSPEDELRCLEVMLREIPKHKGTDKLQAELKAKISRAKADVETAKKTKKSGPSLKLPRQGAGRVVLIGGPNAGKSSLLKAVTRATPEIAPYPFTTREPQLGMMPWEDISVQMVDTPPITADVFDSTLLGLIRGSDLVLLMVDLGADEGTEQLQAVLDQLQGSKTRLAKESYLDEDDIGLSFTQTILVLNKIDDPAAADRIALMREFIKLDFAEHQISAEIGTGLDELKNAVAKALDFVRVYTKLPHKKEADYDKPFTLRRGGTVADVAELIHRDVADNFKYARIWGTNINPASIVKGDYVVSDKDVLEINS